MTIPLSAIISHRYDICVTQESQSTVVVIREGVNTSNTAVPSRNHVVILTTLPDIRVITGH